MRHGSLFSGIGGFDLAAEWAGWDNIFHCEWNDFGQRVLKHYWPKAISYEDIKQTDFTIHRGHIDILTGGFPCQPYSTAGKRMGKNDERHLWPEMLRAIREIQPRWVVGENVRGLLSWNGGLVFDEVQADLEDEGYQVQPYLLPAASVNAPHRRDRVWFVAYSDKYNDGRISREDESKSGEERVQERDEVRQPTESGKVQWTASDSDYRLSEQQKGEIQAGGDTFERSRQDGNAANAHNERLQRRKFNGASNQETKEQGQQSSGSTTKRHKITDWNGWPTQPPICGGDDGIPTELDGITFPKWRNESIKAYGNAVVPQVVYQIFKAINQYELNQ